MEAASTSASHPTPTDAMTVDLQCRQIANRFDGFFEMVIHTAKGSADKTCPVEFDDYSVQVDFTVTEDFPTSNLVTFEL